MALETVKGRYYMFFFNKGCCFASVTTVCMRGSVVSLLAVKVKLHIGELALAAKLVSAAD